MWLVGYGRKPNSRKRGQERMLAEPRRCEIREGKLYFVKAEQDAELGLWICRTCHWRGWEVNLLDGQKKHDRDCDTKKYRCCGLVEPVMQGEVIPSHRADMPALGETETNIRASYEPTMFQGGAATITFPETSDADT